MRSLVASTVRWSCTSSWCARRSSVASMTEPTKPRSTPSSATTGAPRPRSQRTSPEGRTMRNCPFDSAGCSLSDSRRSVRGTRSSGCTIASALRPTMSDTGLPMISARQGFTYTMSPSGSTKKIPTVEASAIRRKRSSLSCNAAAAAAATAGTVNASRARKEYCTASPCVPAWRKIVHPTARTRPSSARVRSSPVQIPSRRIASVISTRLESNSWVKRSSTLTSRTASSEGKASPSRAASFA